MKRLIKKAVNGMLCPLGLRVIRLPTTHLSGSYMFEDIAKILRTNRPICIDVGANRGQTIEALLNSFKTPIIHAFEPSHHTFSILKSKRYPSSVHIHNLALGAGAGKRDFFNYGDSRLSSFLSLSRADENPFRMVDLKGTEVSEIRTVDAFLNESRIDSVDLLKIDTQGFDLEVLKGSTQYLRAGKIRCALVELNFLDLYEGQASPEKIFRFLADANLVLVDLYEKVMQGNRLGWCTALFLHEPAGGST